MRTPEQIAQSRAKRLNQSPFLRAHKICAQNSYANGDITGCEFYCRATRKKTGKRRTCFPYFPSDVENLSLAQIDNILAKDPDILEILMGNPIISRPTNISPLQRSPREAKTYPKFRSNHHK